MPRHPFHTSSEETTMIALVAASLLSLVSTADAAPPTGRAPGTTIPYEEISMTAPEGGCGSYNNCMEVKNFSPDWMALEVPEWGTSSATTNRVFSADAVFDGIYMDDFPVFGGYTTVVLNNQPTQVPVVIGGNFVSAIRPCLTTASVPNGYMSVNPKVRSITIVGHAISVTGNDTVTTLVFDHAKGVLVRAPLKAFGTMRGIYTDSVDLYDANGTPISYGRPFQDARVGPNRCRA